MLLFIKCSWDHGNYLTVQCLNISLCIMRKTKAGLAGIPWTWFLFQNLEMLSINSNNGLVWGYYFLSKQPSRKRCKGRLSFLPFLQSFFFQRTQQRNKEPNNWLMSFSNSVVVNLLLHKESTSKALNSEFWKAMSGKISLAKWAQCAFESKAHLGILSLPKSFSVVWIFLGRGNLNFAFEWNFELNFLFFFKKSLYSFKVMVSQLELVFRTYRETW